MPTSIPRDSQRTKVYKIGWALYSKPLSREACVELVDWAYEQYGMQFGGRVTFNTKTIAYGSEYEVKLPPNGGMTDVTVLHEAAHGITRRLERITLDTWASHGPEFMRVYAELLDRRKVASRAWIVERAKAERVRMARGAAFAPAPVTKVKRRAELRKQVGEAKRVWEQLRSELTALDRDIDSARR